MITDFDQQIKIILEKKFEAKAHSGYDPLDVDQFFDVVIDYITKVRDLQKNLSKELSTRDTKIADLTAVNSNLEKENKELKAQVESLTQEGYGNVKIQRHSTTKAVKLEEIPTEKK